MSALGRIPMDGTFDQEKPLRPLIGRKKDLFSYDICLLLLILSHFKYRNNSLISYSIKRRLMLGLSLGSEVMSSLPLLDQNSSHSL